MSTEKGPTGKGGACEGNGLHLLTAFYTITILLELPEYGSYDIVESRRGHVYSTVAMIV